MKAILTASFTVLMSLAPAFCQEPAKDAPHDIPSAAKATEITGCLSKSGSNYMVASTDGTRMQVTGLATQLDQYANQEVKITGMKVNKDGKDSFTATKVDVVAAACITKS